MDQGTKEWLEWRKQGIGSSEVAAILGISPYKTALQLFLEKTSDEMPKEEAKKNYIFEKGHREEERVRAMYEMQKGEEFAPALVEMYGMNFMRASLDGRSKDGKKIIEIKLANKADHENARIGIVSDKYFAQVQHQLFVTGAESCDYLSWNESEMLIVTVKPDREYQEKMVKACADFWRKVQKKQKPEFQDADFVPLKGITTTVNKWKRLKLKIDALQKQADALKEEIEKAVTHPHMACGNVFITRVERVGNVQYAKIPELQGVDLEKYRGAASSYLKFTIK